MLPPPVIDIEASGFGKGSYPIEVGFVLPDGSSYCTLIHPEPDWQHWDASAEAVHGIGRALLARHGRRSREVALEMNRQLHGLTVYCDAWLQDYSWLGRLFDSAELIPSFALADLRSLLTEEDKALWQDTKAEVAARLKLRRHRASSDARILQTTLVEVKSLCH